MASTRDLATLLRQRLAVVGLALLAAAGPLPAQVGDSAVATDGAEFRQQVPLGAITGNAQMLRQRILSATSYRMTAGDTYELQIQLGSDRVNTFPLVLQDDYQLEIPYVGTVDVEATGCSATGAARSCAASRNRFRRASSASCCKSAGPVRRVHLRRRRQPRHLYRHAAVADIRPDHRRQGGPQAGSQPARAWN